MLLIVRVQTAQEMHDAALQLLPADIAVMVAAAGVFTTASRWPDLVVAGLIASLSLSAAYQIIRLAIVEIRSDY